MKPTPKEIKEFAKQMSDLVYDISNEMETTMNLDSKVPIEFISKVMDTDGAKIRKLLAAAIEQDVKINTSLYLEDKPVANMVNLTEPKLTYQVSLRDFEYVISDYIEKKYAKENHEPKSEEAKFDKETLSKQIFLTRVLSAQYAQRIKRDKIDTRKKKDLENSALLKEISELLTEIKKNNC